MPFHHQPAKPAGSKQTPFRKPLTPGTLTERDLTEAELAALEKHAPQATEFSGSQLQEAIRALQAKAAAEQENLPPPVPPDTPVVRPETRDIADMTPEERERLMQALTEVTRLHSRTPEPVRQPPRPEPPQRPVAEPKMQRVDGVAGAKAFLEQLPDPPEPALPPESEAQPEQPPGDETGSNPPPVACPHCGWDLAREDVPEVTDEDKEAFFHYALGGIFERRYPLWNGKLVVGFRSLTVPEIEAITEQAYKEGLDRYREMIDAMKFVPQSFYTDVLELSIRYRTVLQLCYFESDVKRGSLPLGLSKETNPSAATVWNKPLPEIYRDVSANFLTNEHLYRVVRNKCAQFNRLMGRLEALADTENFT